MNYLRVIDRYRKQSNAIPTSANFLISGCDNLVHGKLLNHLLGSAASAGKSVIILDNCNCLSPDALESYGFQVQDALSGACALADPFQFSTLSGMVRLRSLLNTLSYTEQQKMSLIAYLNFLAHLEKLENPTVHIDIGTLGSYCTAALVEQKLQSLADSGSITQIEHLHLLTKYMEVSTAAAEFENFLYLLLPFIQGPQLVLDAPGAATVFSVKSLDQDTVFANMLIHLLRTALEDCCQDQVTLIILDRGYGDRSYLLPLLTGTDMQVHLLSQDIYTICVDQELISLINRFPVRLYARHNALESCGYIERALGQMQVMQQSRGVQYDYRWKTNSAWDMLLGNNKTVSTTDSIAFEARYPKEMIHCLAAGSAILELGGECATVSI